MYHQLLQYNTIATSVRRPSGTTSGLASLLRLSSLETNVSPAVLVIVASFYLCSNQQFNCV